jgi:hypothetical protein
VVAPSAGERLATADRADPSAGEGRPGPDPVEPRLNLDPARVAVCGDSAGGNLAAVVGQQRRGVGAGICHQVLIFPVTGAAGVGATGSYRDFGTGLGTWSSSSSPMRPAPTRASRR